MDLTLGGHAGEISDELNLEAFAIDVDPSKSTLYPRVEVLDDGRLVLSQAVNVSPRFFVDGAREVLLSADSGATWEECTNPDLPPNWPGSSTRERYDRSEFELSDGSWVAIGAVGWQAWDLADRAKAVAERRYVTPDSPPGQPNVIGVGTNTLYVQRSRDRGATWSRSEYALPAAGWTLGQPRNIQLDDGTWVLPLRQRSHDAQRGHVLVARVSVAADGERVRVYAVPRDLDGFTGSESAIAEVAPNHLVMLIRADSSRGGDGRMLSSWSEDGGKSWSVPIGTNIEGWAPHLLKLKDGRLVCTYGYHSEPFGVRAVISADGGQTWDTPAPLQLATVSEHGDGAFHPITVQLPDERLYTVYYDSVNSQCNTMGVRWNAPSLS